ncbi:MAG: glutamine--fructose-6-phosphate transaminase (isomerizing) [Gammaproteobacteria bacterium]|nr:glutamine--fructose-6-phosphate transaminase (isomerizing) [Gammaproteobacteria bacterium]
MCGIVGAISRRNVTPLLLEGLKKLEYRGYDSAGFAVINKYHHLKRLRIEGRVKKLVDLSIEKDIKGKIGIAHTRWATHGKPLLKNAHPHVAGNVAIVHNGIIENYVELREKLLAEGCRFHSKTDSEVIVHLVNQYLQKTDNLLEACKKVRAELRGAYAIGIISADSEDRIIAIRSGSPLVIGIGIEENFIGSDPIALAQFAQNFIYLEEGDIAEITLEKVSIYDLKNTPVSRKISSSKISADSMDKGEFRHYMEKEIFEQSDAIQNCLLERIGKNHILDNAFGEKAAKIFSKIKRVQITACGTSFYAGFVAKYWLEGIAKLPTNIEVASEFRYRDVVVEPDTLFITISQSGETADTLEALRRANKLGYKHSLAICNVAESSLSRESDLLLTTKAGPEIGVASTKAFTTQLTALLLLTISLAKHRLPEFKKEAELVAQLHDLPDVINKMLALDRSISRLAPLFADKDHAFFLGRGIHFPIAMEGALKLKEISYLHAEAYPSGELKHGPLALIEAGMPVVVVAPHNNLIDKLISNIHEVQARSGKLIIFADDGVSIPSEKDLLVINMPAVAKYIAPIAHIIPLQLLAYHVALIKGTDVDQPRNLAKSVTVE